MVYLKISHMKGVTRFDKKGNLCSQYVGPYEILQLAGKVAYKLKLPSEQESVHPLFHVFMNKMSIGNPISILPIEGLGVDENLLYEEVPVEILHPKVKKLRNKEVDSIKSYKQTT